MNTIKCPECKGEQVISHNQKVKLKHSEAKFEDQEECPTCNGEGVIERHTSKGATQTISISL